MTDEEILEQQAVWQVRAAAWELAAFSFRMPTTEQAAAAISGEWAEAAREIAEAVGITLPAAFDEQAAALAQEAAGQEAEPYMHVLRTEHTRLFVGAPKAACSPYEGIWRAEDDKVQPLLFVNPHSMDVERFFKKCGLGRPEGTNEPLDAIATECEFMQFMALRMAGAELPEGSPADEALPGGSALAAYAQFKAEHLDTWADRFAAKVQTESRCAFYRAAGAFLAAALTMPAE